MSDFDTLYPDPLLDLQDQIAERLGRLRFFSRFEIVSERPKTIDTKVKKIVAKWKGIFISILVTAGRVVSPELKGPQCRVTVELSVAEQVTVNRQGDDYVTASMTITQLIRGLHFHKPAIARERLKFASFGYEDVDGKGSSLMMIAAFETEIVFPQVQPAELLGDDDGTLIGDDDGTAMSDDEP